MRVKTITFSTTELNVTYSGVIKKDAFLDIIKPKIFEPGNFSAFRKYPRKVQIVNTSGTAIEFAIISNTEDDETTFNSDIQNFGWILVPNNATFNDSLSRIYKISARSSTGSGASSSLRIDLYPFYGDTTI